MSLCCYVISFTYKLLCFVSGRRVKCFDVIVLVMQTDHHIEIQKMFNLCYPMVRSNQAIEITGCCVISSDGGLTCERAAFESLDPVVQRVDKLLSSG